jgi:hypothetical protein
MFGYYKFRRKLKENKLKRKFNGGANNFNFQKNRDELYLFGNGYTLKDVDLQQFDGIDSFTCNAFFRMPGFSEFIKNNNVLDFAMDSFAEFYKTSKKNGISVQDSLEFYVNPKIGIGLPLITPVDFFPYITELEKDQSLITFDALTKNLGYKKEDIQLARTFGHTPQIMIYCAILMNYKKIHLFGLEHNYVKDILNKDSNCGTHFYGDTYEELLLYDRGPGDRNHFRIKLSKLFEGNAHIFKGYEQLADLAKEKGIEIMDHSNGSLFMFQDYSLWDLVEPKDKN